MAALRGVVKLCYWFPDAALIARRFADRTAKRAHETAPRKDAPDLTKLLAYLAPKVGAPADPERVELAQFSHGQSNPTFTLRWDEGAVVVRKRPSGALLRGAHDVAREHAFATHLGPLGVPTPTPRDLCRDAKVLGTEFWVYDFVEGRHFRDPYLEKASIQDRPGLFFATAAAAARLHGAAPPPELVEALGGAPSRGYLERQVRTWTRQYEGADERLGVATAPAVADHAARLAAAVADHADAVDETATGDLCVAHGDFRCDNVIFRDGAPDVAAVLDWELATLGHPVADVAYLCMPYAIPPLPAGPLSGFRGLRNAEAAHGIPPAAAVVRAYAEAVAAGADADRTKRLQSLFAAAAPHFDLFTSVCYFRIASICRGVYARSKGGNASSANADAVGALADTLLDVSVRLAADHADVVAGKRAAILDDLG